GGILAGHLELAQLGLAARVASWVASWGGGSGGNLGGYSRVASLEVFFCISSMVIGRPGF
ncbi:MAG TPA: hypothetical protein VFD15_01120, partial [Clostridia bacterium]|nr:hypothetical protein [Clostridia bacterium]